MEQPVISKSHHTFLKIKHHRLDVQQQLSAYRSNETQTIEATEAATRLQAKQQD